MSKTVKIILLVIAGIIGGVWGARTAHHPRRPEPDP